ncbi:MAG: V-type ATP synthase subunit F, partial [Candidatus Bathyarchaeia archaeon]
MPTRETILNGEAGEKKMGQDENRVAIIADKYLALGFRMAGVIAFPVRDAGEAAAALDRILEEDKYDVIIITENLSSALKKQRGALLA